MLSKLIKKPFCVLMIKHFMPSLANDLLPKNAMSFFLCILMI